MIDGSQYDDPNPNTVHPPAFGPDRCDRPGGHASACRRLRCARRAADGDRSRRSADYGRHAGERHALLHPRQRAAQESRRAAARRQRRVGARRRRPARPGALCRAHGLQRHEELPQAGGDRVPAVDGHALRRAHQRQHELRPDGLRAPDSHRQSRGHRSSLLILEDWAHAVSFEPAEIDKERGVILEEWRTGLGAGARILDVQLPVLLKDSRYADRLPIGKAGDHPHLHLRAPEEVLYRLVSPRSHGGDCRRRLRSGGDRDAHQVPLRLDSGCRHRRGRGRSTTYPISRARDTPSRPTPRLRGRRSASPPRWPRAIRRRSAPTASR